jgi:alkylation response protein AidB-like acyl-CoA dehydrogenase
MAERRETAIASGGSFLIRAATPDGVRVPEDLSADHQAIGRMVDEFWQRDVAPRLDALLSHEPGVARALLRRAAALGLTGMQIPEEYGGLGLDLSSVIVAIEHLAEDASYLGWHLGHSGIGTLPLVLYGTEEQKRRYLPRLASAELIAAYALTEPEAGSDALAIRTRADLSPDGRHYVLTGQKMWITNGGEADLFTVFAKVNGEAFTAFLVERAFGVTSGAQERKMGLVGTSTTALYLDQVKVPAANVLGEVGKGHHVAFNVLNIGRLEIGPLALRSAKRVLAVSQRYAEERRAFGTAIANFGAVQQMLADAAIRIYAAESATWRVVGLIEDDVAMRRHRGATSSSAEMQAFEEFGGECAIVKVFASEMLDTVADYGVQVHGGYGYHRDYYVERAYRDARINRIFEGTNEINRILIPGLLLKRLTRRGLSLLDAARASRPAGDEPPAASDREIVARARSLALLALAAAHARHGDSIRHAQEVAMAVADAIIEAFVMESSLLRGQALAGRAAATAGAPDAGTLTAAYLRDALPRVARAAELVIAAVTDAGPARELTLTVRSLAATEPIDVLALRRAIARSMLAQN